MNEYVQKYLEKRNAEKKEEQRRQVLKLVSNLRIGAREYPVNSDYNLEDYPYWDKDKGKYYRYNVGELTDEEFDLLMKDRKEEPKYVEAPERSDWYNFATIMIVLSGIGLFILGIVSISEENALFFLIGLGEFFMVSLFCAIVQLLAGIKQGVDTLLQNTKK